MPIGNSYARQVRPRTYRDKKALCGFFEADKGHGAANDEPRRPRHGAGKHMRLVYVAPYEAFADFWTRKAYADPEGLKAALRSFAGRVAIFGGRPYDGGERPVSSWTSVFRFPELT